MEGFFFNNADEAMLFFEACEKEGAKTLPERMAIMRQFVKEKKVKYVPHPEEWMEGKNVMDLRLKDKNNE